ncbi:MAG: hypothetical protein ACI4OR_04150 [Alphaproteobacteria bacterium]
MLEEEYKNVILIHKKFLKDHLTLHTMPVGPESIYGYATPDAAFLSQQWAKETGAFYFDIIDFFDAVHQKDQKRINNYKTQLRDKKRIITPKIVLGTNEEQTDLSCYWLPLFTELKEVWKNPLLEERRLVVPLQLQFGNLICHASVACFNFKPSKDEASVILLEQHAQKKEEPGYEKDSDYMDGIKLHAQVFMSALHQTDCGLLGIKNVKAFINNKPICRRHNVCGVVASELARRLLKADDPISLAKSGIVISNEEVDKLHARNQKLEAKYGYFPLMVIQKKGRSK